MTRVLHAVIRLIALALVAAGNALVLTVLLGLGFIIAEKIFGTMPPPASLPFWSALGVVAIGGLSASPIGAWIVRLFWPIRQPTRREEAVLAAAFDRVREAYRLAFGQRLKAKPCRATGRPSRIGSSSSSRKVVCLFSSSLLSADFKIGKKIGIFVSFVLII